MRSQLIPCESSSKPKEKRNSRDTDSQLGGGRTPHTAPRFPRKVALDVVATRGKANKPFPLVVIQVKKQIHHNLLVNNIRSIMLKFPSGSLCWSSTTDAVAVKNFYFHKTLFHFLLATKVQLRCKIIFFKKSLFLCSYQRLFTSSCKSYSRKNCWKCFKGPFPNKHLVKPLALQQKE